MVSKKTGSTCAMPLDSMFTSISVFGMPSLILTNIFFFGSICEPDKKSAAVFNFPGMCSILNIYCSKKLQSFHKGGGINFL